MLKEKTFNTGSVTINYAEGPPAGSPLVLLHGGGDRWQNFLPIIPTLAMRWQIFAVDLRGHGKSGRVTRKYRPEHYVKDIVALLEKQFTNRVILLGHSLGGWIAMMVTAQLPKKVKALILGDPPLNLDRFVAVESSPERIGMWNMMLELASSSLSVPELATKLANLPVSNASPDGPSRYEDLPNVDSASILAWAETLSQVDPNAAKYHAEGRISEYIQNVNLESDLQRINCPLLLLQGDPAYGALVSDEDVENVMAWVDNCIHVRLEGLGHDLGLSSWNVTLMLRAITNFLESF